MKTAYIHGTIHNSRFQAFIVEDGRFKKFGSNQSILREKVDQVIDLKGAYVMPGFHDSHMHLTGIGKSMRMVDVSSFNSIETLIEKTKKTHPLGFLGRGFHESQFQEKRSITKQDLDRVSSTHPIVIYRVCGHAVVANSVAIDLALKAVDANNYDQDSYDLKTGIFKEEAIHIPLSTVDKPTKETIKKDALSAQDYLLSQGITAIGSDDFSMYDCDFRLVNDALKELSESGALKIRVYEQANIPRLKDFEAFLKEGYARKSYGRYRLGPLKLLADGSLGANSAYMSAPYEDVDTVGIRVFTPETLKRYIELCNTHGMDFAIHAIGDQMIEEILDAVEEGMTEEERLKRRHSIIHAQLARADQIVRMQALNVGAQTQPIFINSDLAIVKEKLGERAENAYLFKTMAEKGVKTTISTDAPVEDSNPFENLYTAITRRSLKHPELGVYLESEAFSFNQAIDLYTRAPAYLTYQEHQLGRLAVNYFADFIVVENVDVEKSESLLKAKVKAVFIEGENLTQTS